jgi:hypothetical protein
MPIKSDEELQNAMADIIVTGKSPQEALADLLMSGDVDVPTLDSLKQVRMGTTPQPVQQAGVPAEAQDEEFQLFPGGQPSISTPRKEAIVEESIEKLVTEPTQPRYERTPEQEAFLDIRRKTSRPEAIEKLMPEAVSEIETEREEERAKAVEAASLEMEGAPLQGTLLEKPVDWFLDTFVSRDARIRALKENDPVEYIWGLMSLPSREWAMIVNSLQGEDGTDLRVEQNRALFMDKMENARNEMDKLRQSPEGAGWGEEALHFGTELVYELVNDPYVVSSVAKTPLKKVINKLRKKPPKFEEFGLRKPSAELAEKAEDVGTTAAGLDFERRMNSLVDKDLDINTVQKIQGFGGPTEAMQDAASHFNATAGGKASLDAGTAKDFTNRFLHQKFEDVTETALSDGTIVKVPSKRAVQEGFFETEPFFEKLKDIETRAIPSVSVGDFNKFEGILADKLGKSAEEARDVMKKFNADIRGLNGGEVRETISKLNRMINDQVLPVGVTQEDLRSLRNSLNEFMSSEVPSKLQKKDIRLSQDYKKLKSATEKLSEDQRAVFNMIGLDDLAKRKDLSEDDVLRAQGAFQEFIDKAVSDLSEKGSTTGLERVRVLDRLLDMNYGDLVERTATMQELGAFSSKKLVNAARQGIATGEEIIQEGAKGMTRNPFIKGMDITLLPSPLKLANFAMREIWEKFGVGAIGKQRTKFFKKLAKEDTKLAKLLETDPTGSSLPPTAWSTLAGFLIKEHKVGAQAFMRALKNNDMSYQELDPELIEEFPNFFRAVDNAEKRDKKREEEFTSPEARRKRREEFEAGL